MSVFTRKFCFLFIVSFQIFFFFNPLLQQENPRTKYICVYVSKPKSGKFYFFLPWPDAVTLDEDVAKLITSNSYIFLIICPCTMQ